MSEREPDFEFDFFDEPETQEASGRGDRTLRRPLGRGGRGPVCLAARSGRAPASRRSSACSA